MKILTFLLISLISYSGLSQDATIINIEELSKPEKLLGYTNPDNALELMGAEVEKHSKLPESLVTFNEHPFLNGIITSYKEHRPFVISPDIFWLLISQGLSRHINSNPESFRNDFVKFQGRKTLTVVVNGKEIELGNPNSNWEIVFPQFVNQIGDFTGKKLTNILTANFSTTDETSRIVSQITIMETLKAYFDYKVSISGCGIPSITIEGTTEDWKSVLEKTRFISKFKLSWWTRDLEPILEKIIEAKKGEVDLEFWMNIVRIHSKNKYGSKTTIDGWIVKFFPYTKEGKKNTLINLPPVEDLASEIVKVPFVYENRISQKSYNMEFWAGFIGLSQNKNNFTLKPQIGWAVTRNQSNKKLEADYSPDIQFAENISFQKIDLIPSEIIGYKEINFLHLSFNAKVQIPDQLAEVEIHNLELKGKITDLEIERIVKLFPKSNLIINGKILRASN